MMATAAVQAPTNNINHFMNTQAGPSPPGLYQYEAGAYKTTSMAPSPPPTSDSPTNYRCHSNVRQLRQPRQPMYIPAALRPTDFPTRPTDIPSRPRAPDTPPHSKDNSFDSDNLSSPSTPNLALLLDGRVEDENQLRRGLSMAISDSWEEEIEEITGLPTTAHWKPDVSSNECNVCHVQFTWFFRRHHCRRCGHLVCDNHIKNIVPLDQNARFHSKGQPSKACKSCYEEWKVIEKLRDSRSSSVADLRNSSPGLAVPIPKPRASSEEARIGSMARSEGMIWSTF